MKNIKCRATLSYVYNLGEQVIQNVTNSNFVEAEYREVIIKAKKFASTTYFKPGDKITYTLVLTNVGTYEATSLVVHEELKHQVLITDSVNLRSIDEAKLDYSVNNDNLTLTLSTLKAGQTVYISYQTLVDEIVDISYTITNRSNLLVDEELEVSSNDVELVQKYAKLLCDKSQIGVVYPNKSFEYTLTVENVGNEIAYDLELIDQLPNNYILESLYIGEEEAQVYFIENGYLKFKLDAVEANEKKVIKVVGFIKRNE